MLYSFISSAFIRFWIPVLTLGLIPPTSAIPSREQAEKSREIPVQTLQKNLGSPTGGRFSVDLGEGYILHFEDATIDDAGALYKKATLYRNNELIFRDDLSPFQVTNEYPRLMPRKQGQDLLLMTRTSTYLSTILLLRIRNNKVYSAQRLPLPLLPLQDIDEDGWPEGFGFLEEYEEIDEKSVSYSPVLAWESRFDGISIDTIASMKLTMMVYGQYNGLEANPKLICPCRKKVEDQLTHLRALKTN